MPSCLGVPLIPLPRRTSDLSLPAGKEMERLDAERAWFRATKEAPVATESGLGLSGARSSSASVDSGFPFCEPWKKC